MDYVCMEAAAWVWIIYIQTYICIYILQSTHFITIGVRIPGSNQFQVHIVRFWDCPDVGIWPQYSGNPGFKRLLIWLLNDSVYNVIILFLVQLTEYTGWVVGGGRTGHGEELMPCDEAPN